MNDMKKLEKNVINLFGEKGNKWLNNLPQITDALAKLWSLTDIKPVANMNWNYVATALKNHNIPVVLKISCDKELISNESKALKHFDGHGAIHILDQNEEYNALLLEQAIPGNLLKDHHPKNIIETMEIYSAVIKELADNPMPSKNEYTHVEKWLKAIDRITDKHVEKYFIDKAKELRLNILNSVKQEYLCHGDLHLENIIHNGSKWVSIDPKGIIGEMAFEAAAFDLISPDEIKKNQNVSKLIEERITLLAKILNLDFDRLLAWFFLRTILSAQWFIEDKGNPSEMLNLAKYIYPFFHIV